MPRADEADRPPPKPERKSAMPERKSSMPRPADLDLQNGPAQRSHPSDTPDGSEVCNGTRLQLGIDAHDAHMCYSLLIQSLFSGSSKASENSQENVKLGNEFGQER